MTETDFSSLPPWLFQDHSSCFLFILSRCGLSALGELLTPQDAEPNMHFLSRFQLEVWASEVAHMSVYLHGV